MLHYIEHHHIERHTILHVVATRVGEPMRFGWEASDLPGWLSRRGFELLSDHDDEALARVLFPPAWAEGFGGAGGRIAVARPV